MLRSSAAAEAASRFDEAPSPAVAAGLHAKTYAMDGRRIFVASGAVTVYDADPQTTVWKRMQVGFLAGLPIDWLL